MASDSDPPPRPEMAQVDPHHRRSGLAKNESHGPPDQSLQDIIASVNAAHDYTPNDPDNPRNFSPLRRTLSIVAVTLLACVATIGGAIYAPAQNDVARDLHCSDILSVLPLSLYNLGLAFGPMVGAPLSETYGRKAVYVVTTPVFMLFLVGSALSQTIASLTVCRFFAGMFASSLINNTPATILDQSPGRYRGTSLGIYYTLPSFGSALGPLMGGLLVQWRGWRWTQWTALIITVAFYVPVCFTRETYKKVIIKRRAIRLGLLDSASQRTSPGRAFRYFATTLVQRPLHMLFTEPIVTLVSLYNGFLYGLLYTFIVSVPWIFEHYYEFGETARSLSYLGIIVGTLAAAVPLVLIDLRYYQRRLSRWNLTHDEATDPLPSEHRLIGAMIGSFLLPACLFVVGWTVHFRVHWAVPLVLQGGVMFSSLLIYATANLFTLDAYGPLYGASASGALMLSRYALSAAFPLFALKMYKALGAGWATTLLAFVTLCMAPIPWCFWVYGAALRRRSKYERSS